MAKSEVNSRLALARNFAVTENTRLESSEPLKTLIPQQSGIFF